MKKRVELLAPAGSVESLRAGIAAGADAVYIGGQMFGARAYADNPNQEDLCRAIDFAHLHGARLYLTVNTLVKDQELERLPEFLEPFYRQGLDGVIVQDLGVWERIRREFPGMELHASTQMTLLGAPGAALLKELGAARIVPARELSLEEIGQIKKEVDIEVETFVHGALCYCYSGQCLFSSLLGGRSGNRGRCAQPCRLPYRAYDKRETGGRALSRKGEEYLLSPRDLCTVEMIPELIGAGIDSFKIEGRMKRPEYTAGVVQIYRKYVDRYLQYGREGFRVKAEDLEQLQLLYNRGGFTRGYYEQKNGRDMISLVRPNHFEEGSGKRRYEELLAQLKKEYVDQEKKEKIQGSLRISKERPNVFQIKWKDIQVEVTGEPAQEPQNQPMGEAQIRRQMEKTGNTPFVWEKLSIETEGPVFVPVQSLNGMRRQGLLELEERICGLGRRMSEKKPYPVSTGEMQAEQVAAGENLPLLRVQLEEPWMLEPVLKEPLVEGIYIEAEQFLGQKEDGKFLEEIARELTWRCHEAGKACILALPDIFRLGERRWYENAYPILATAGFDGMLVKNLDEVGFLRSHRYQGLWIADAGLYTFNRQARRTLEGLGASGFTLPYELRERELLERGTAGEELVVYGHQPMMITANCVAKTLGQCKGKPGVLYLEDRLQNKLPVKRFCGSCHNVIYNPKPLYLLDCSQELSRLRPGSLRLRFTIEKREELLGILSAAVGILKQGGMPSKAWGDFTRGHMRRGVE